MPGCKPPCVKIVSGTDRQKWNYVRNLYQPSYVVDSSYNYVDPRPASDPARIEDEAGYFLDFNEDLAVWQSLHYTKPFEKFLQWRNEIGTTAYGNLPQHKRQEHVGHCWAPCPYSTQSSDFRTRSLLGITISGSLPTKVNHVLSDGREVFLQNADGGVFICPFDGCTHYITNGTRYHYL
jgi:hypothetical protein